MPSTERSPQVFELSKLLLSIPNKEKIKALCKEFNAFTSYRYR